MNWTTDEELRLYRDADARAQNYIGSLRDRRVFPGQEELAGLAAFDHDFPEIGRSAEDTLALLDAFGSPATAVSNGPNYFGFVVGSALPPAHAAERLASAWDQAASSFETSPVCATIERTAGRWVVDALDLPRDAAVGFCTSAGSGAITCLAAARRALLARHGWDVDNDGLAEAPSMSVVASASVHITMKKAFRVLGFGLRNVEFVAIDENARLTVAALPALTDRTILCLQAGEVNTGEFDDFSALIALARNAGSWVHVDGAFGLWARASSELRHLTDGVDGADSWTTDGHKWLNTPYDSAIAICRDPAALSAAMNADAAYSTAAADAQKNLVLEFSRRPRGLPIWAALRSLGRAGVADLVERNCRQTRVLRDGLRAMGLTVLNRVVLNQVLVRAESDEATVRLREAAQQCGELWFSGTTWRDRPAFRMSVSSWRTNDTDIERALATLARLRHD